MDKALKLARRRTGLAKFERECRLKRDDDGTLKKAYLIPGTQEAQQHYMLWIMCSTLAHALERWPTLGANDPKKKEEVAND